MIKKKISPPQSLLQELFEYRENIMEDEQGKFTCGGLWWKITRGGAKKGEKAGNLDGSGYIMIGVEKKFYRESQLVLVYFHGEKFINYDLLIDHKDGRKFNDCIDNLEQKTPSENCANRCTHRNGATMGVYYNKGMCKWVAVTKSVGGQKLILGHYGSRDDAERVRKEWETSGFVPEIARKNRDNPGIFYRKKYGYYEIYGDGDKKFLGTAKTIERAREIRKCWEDTDIDFKLKAVKKEKFVNIKNSPKRHLSKEEILEYLVYDRNQGKFYHKNGGLAGSGYNNLGAYIHIVLYGKRYAAHELVLICENIKIDDSLEILHKDNNKSNNYYDNLTQDTHKCNMEEMGASRKLNPKPKIENDLRC